MTRRCVDFSTFGQYPAFEHFRETANTSWSAPFEDSVCFEVDGEEDIGSVSAYLLKLGRLNRQRRPLGRGSLGSFYPGLAGVYSLNRKGGEAWRVMRLASFEAVRKHRRPCKASILEPACPAARGRAVYIADGIVFCCLSHESDHRIEKKSA